MVSDANVQKLIRLRGTWCLNPCCNGIWSQTLTCRLSEVGTKVLILVVMEYGLRPVRIMESKVCFVLILVVMEYGLRP